ncbi:MAG: FAD-binding oxidoreductase, partial [Planctomycetes bacterium]|nr:FAD-binding oxidoreductase [Planctomycetota bacterium]
MNLLESTPIRTEKCPRIEDRKRISAEFAGYLADESRTRAEGLDVIFFPENPAQVAGAVTQCHDAGMKLTVAGARTGIVGGAVPLKSDAVVALEKLNHIKSVRYDPDRDAFFARVQPGVVLADFQEALRTTRPADLPWISDKNREMGIKKIKNADGRLFYPVDPTETSAQIGGTVATNASGARTFHYGATREWVEGVTVVLSSGEILQLRRGDATADDGIFRLANSLGQETTIDLPDLNIPDTKHTAGYYLVHGMDAVDLFVGSEGTLGLLVEIELRLAFEPPERLFLTAFLPSEENVLEFVNRARISEEIDPLAIEYIGPKALDLLRDKR